MQEDEIRVVIDRSDISQMISRLALGMDLRDVEMFQSCWADEFYLSVPPLAGDSVPLEGTMRAEEHARNAIGMLSEFTASHHVLANHCIDVDGDTAKCSVYLIGTHTLLGVEDGDPVHTIGARYDFECSRTPDGWKITHMLWTRVWSTGNGGLWDIVGKRVAAKAAS